MPETTSDLPSVTATAASVTLSGSARSCTPTPPFGRIGSSSSGNTSSRASDDSARRQAFPLRDLQTGTGTCARAPSGTLMKSLPCLVFVARSPSLQRKPVARECWHEQRRVSGSPRPIQTMSSDAGIDQRVHRRAVAAARRAAPRRPRVKLLPPEAEHGHRVGGLAFERLQVAPSPSLKFTVARSTPWPVRARIQPFFDRITVIGSSTTVRSICARSSVLISVRRSSP